MKKMPNKLDRMVKKQTVSRISESKNKTSNKNFIQVLIGVLKYFAMDLKPKTHQTNINSDFIGLLSSVCNFLFCCCFFFQITLKICCFWRIYCRCHLFMVFGMWKRSGINKTKTVYERIIGQQARGNQELLFLFALQSDFDFVWAAMLTSFLFINAVHTKHYFSIFPYS